jgi:hypothetical protein
VFGIETRRPGTWASCEDPRGLFTSNFLFKSIGTIQIMRIIGQLRLILMNMGHRLMTYTTQLIPKIISNNFLLLFYSSCCLLFIFRIIILIVIN